MATMASPNTISMRVTPAVLRMAEIVLYRGIRYSPQNACVCGVSHCWPCFDAYTCAHANVGPRSGLSREPQPAAFGSRRQTHRATVADCVFASRAPPAPFRRAGPGRAAQCRNARFESHDLQHAEPVRGLWPHPPVVGGQRSLLV